MNHQNKMKLYGFVAFSKAAFNAKKRNEKLNKLKTFLECIHISETVSTLFHLN